MLRKVKSVTMAVGSCGNGMGKTSELRGRRISMIKWLNDLHLALEASLQTEQLEAWC